MAVKYLLYAGLLFLFIVSCEGCGDSSTGPDLSLEFVEFSTSNPISLLNFIGIDLNDLESYYLVDWTLAVDFDDGTKTPLRRLFARGFTPNPSATSILTRGLDMGTVSFARIANDSTQFSLDLSRNFSPAVGFIYRSLNSPSPDAPRFVPSDSVQFKRSGSSDFDSLTIKLTTPSDSICFTSPFSTSTLDPSQGLRLTWRGGVSTEQILLTMQPAIQFSNGRGFLSGIYRFFDSNPREFTLSPQQLQNFLDHADDELALQERRDARVAGIFVYAAQPVICQVIVGSRRSVALAFASDQLFLPLQ
ncbi:hypothetical protein MJD09_07300 [bacterium]|nr:hypothetical protein [bacterium]